MEAAVTIDVTPPPYEPAFDPEPLRKPDPRSRLILQGLTSPLLMGLLRRGLPNGRVLGQRMIISYDDVQEALSRPEIFQVPWAPKMQLLAPSRRPFVLATEDAAEHRRGQRAIMQVFKREDLGRIAAISARTAESIVGKAGDSIDALHDLIVKVPLAIYREYYGLDVRSDEFALWLMAISNYTFRKIGPDPQARDVALAGAERVGYVVDAAIARAMAGLLDEQTVVARLVALRRAQPEDLPDDSLRSQLVGMVSGNVPVSSKAGGNILEVLLQRPAAMAAARQAARDDDDEALSRCLIEALRFNPINPGLWRVCCEDYTIAAGTRRERRIRRGEKVLVFLQAAMQDPERVSNPGRFDPDRSPSASMVFGYGRHWCIGAPMAVAQLVATFKPLLLRGFRRATGADGRMRYFGAFPEHLHLVLGQG